MSEDRAIWHIPLLVLAGLTGLAGVGAGIAVMVGSLPQTWGVALQYGLGGASLTFTLARIAHARQVTRRELELLVLGAGVLLAQYFVIGAAVLVGLAIVLAIMDVFD